MQHSDLQQLLAKGMAHHQAGRLTEAEAVYRQILAAAPDHAEGLHMLGVLAGQQGRHEAAVELISRAIALARSKPVAAFHYNLASILKELGKRDETAGQYERVLALNPGHIKAHANLGLLRMEQGRLDEAAAHYRRLIALRPEDAESHNTLGTLLQRLGRPDEAVKHYRQALALRPDYAEAHSNLGAVLHERDQLEDAAAQYERASALAPGVAKTHFNLGLVRMAQGRLDEAIASYDRAIAVTPDDADLRWSEALTYLLGGDFAAGWEKYEWRWRRKELPPRLFTQNPWNGGDLAGRTILLHAEQGIGDTLDFIRYAPLVKAKGATVIVECQQGLARLLKSAAGIDQIVTAGDKLPAFDCHAPLLSLPRIFGTRLETIPAQVPYLAAEPELMEGWAHKLAALPGRKVGLAWRGNPTHANDRRRSIPVETIAPLCATPGISWVSIQADARLEEIAVLSRHGPILNAGPALNDWTDTAALVATLDLVVSVDTAVVHLAGALNKPAWVLLPFAPDWRWMLTREDSPWYPALRLLRQPNPANWQDVVANVRAELTKIGSSSSQE